MKRSVLKVNLIECLNIFWVRSAIDSSRSTTQEGRRHTCEHVFSCQSPCLLIPCYPDSRFSIIIFLASHHQTTSHSAVWINSMITADLDHREKSYEGLIDHLEKLATLFQMSQSPRKKRARKLQNLQISSRRKNKIKTQGPVWQRSQGPASEVMQDLRGYVGDK